MLTAKRKGCHWENEASDRSHASEIPVEPADQAHACFWCTVARICVAGNERTEDREATAHPVGDGRIGNQLWVVAEHGMKAGYVRNIERDSHVRLKLREGFRTRWHTGTAHLLSDDDPSERQRWLASQLPSSAGNARAVRLFGTQLLTIRIDLDC
jgi:hypothetical protein